MESSLFMFVSKVVRTNPLFRAVCVSVQNMELDPYVNVVYVLHCFLNLPISEVGTKRWEGPAGHMKFSGTHWKCIAREFPMLFQFVPLIFTLAHLFI